MAAASVNLPPLGTVIGNDDGSASIWNGKQWAPAAKGPDGSWSVDSAKMTQMGLGNAQGAAGSPDEQKYIGALRSQNDIVQNLADDAGDFMRRNKATPTGGYLALPFAGKIAKAVGADPTDNLAQMDRDSTQMATSLRVAGQRLTQMEFMKNLGAGPSIGTQGPVNSHVTDQILKYAAPLAQAKTQLYSDYLNQHRTLAGADQAWAQFKAAHVDPKTGFYSPAPVGQARPANPLTQRSAQAATPVAAGSTVDVFGRPVNSPATNDDD